MISGIISIIGFYIIYAITDNLLLALAIIIIYDIAEIRYTLKECLKNDQ